MNNKKRRWIEVGRVSSRFKSKKAQITVFIILGILMLLALTLVIVLKKEIITFKSDEVIPTEKGKVENFITTCMDKIGDEALFKIGIQGGYVEVPEDLTDASVSLIISPMNVIPFWANGMDTNIPSQLQIKDRIDEYMVDNLRPCLFEMEAFQEAYDLIEKSDLTSDTQIVDKQVIFKVHWDVEINNKAGEVVSEVINHQTESPIKLKRVRDLAERITLRELDSLKLEDITQDLIALEHPSVPVAGIELSCSKKTWNIKDVEDTLMNMLRVNIKQLKVKGTEIIDFPDVYYPELEDGLTYYENHYLWDLGADYNVPDTSVMFNFDSTYPYIFGVTPASGKKMKSSQLGGGGVLSFICIQNWKFTYDLIYPVLIRVRDETTGYDFNFAFTVHLLQNLPNRGQKTSRPSYLLPTQTGEDYCKVRNIPMNVKTYEFVENGEGVSYREDLGDVNLTFSCLRYACEIGTTEYDFNNLGYAGITTGFPYCVGGILRGIRGDYKENWVRVVTAPDKEVELDLTPLISIPLEKIKVVKHELPIYSGLPVVGPPKELNKNDMALIKLKFSGTNNTEKELTHEINFVDSKEFDKSLKEKGSIELLANADFSYNLEINVINEEEFIGGYKGKWTIPWSKLTEVATGTSELIFHVYSKENPSEDEMLELMLGMEENSLNIPLPEIK